MRQRIAQNMRQSLNNTAQLTLHRKVNADRLLDFKARLSEELKDADQDGTSSYSVNSPFS
jgi:pyruvate dehydrogenase E2 component (dihydrolipoamide acetyltransferase)